MIYEMNHHTFKFKFILKLSFLETWNVSVPVSTGLWVNFCEMCYRLHINNEKVQTFFKEHV